MRAWGTNALARNPGRLEIDHSERKRIIQNINEWIDTGEFAAIDVLMIRRLPEIFVSYLKELEEITRNAKQEHMELIGELNTDYHTPVFLIKTRLLKVVL